MKIPACVIILKDDEDNELAVDMAHYDELKDKLLNCDDSAEQWVEVRSALAADATMMLQISDIKTLFRSTQAYIDAVEAQAMIEKFTGGD